MSEAIVETYKILNIAQKTSLPYQPRCNGVVERLHRTIETSLTHWASKKPRSWDEVLPLVMLAYNSQVSATTGICPFKLMFGHNPRLPVDMVFGQPPMAEELPEYEYNVWLEDTMYALNEQARNNLIAAMQSTKDRADKRRFGKPLQKGDFVWLLKGAFESGSRKFQRAYTGPFKVVIKLSDTSYRLKQMKDEFREFNAHFNRLKKCNLSDEVILSYNVASEKFHKL